jgi:PAS domain S-box-containing protein
MMDITERKLAETSLKTRETQLAHISRNVRVVFYEAEPVEPFAATWVSDNIELLSGFPPQQFLDIPTLWSSRLHPHDRGRVFREIPRLFNEGTLATEYRWRRADGVYRWFLDQTVMTRSLNGQSMAILGTWQDITDQKVTQEQLRQSLDQLRTLSHRLEAIREDERSRLSREIHDELGGRLTCLRCDLLRLSRTGSELAPPNGQAPMQEKLESMIQLVDQTITVVQQVATDLRPQMLDELGLLAAIEWQTQDFEKRTGIPCQFLSTAQDFAIDRERATGLFRICQEALTNVARHAHATSVMVRVDKTRDHVMLEVEDNGDGFAAELLTDSHALGLRGMRERAELLNGKFRISGIPGRGTRVTVRIPIEEDSREAGGAHDDGDHEPHVTLRHDGIGRSTR